ncbi:unnamed protein product [Linum tenue]|uniref:Uncharacterized protein n=1 Tax=Linum tenue TaxID=586396 RepID=A0AAV0Q1I8_9ROSI|nr:unnamed protein product [Linum tenue]
MWQVTKPYNYIHKYDGHKLKLMAAVVRNKQDLFILLGYYHLSRSLSPLLISPQSAANYSLKEEELVKWDQLSLASAMGLVAVELLATGLDGYAIQAK